MTAGASMLAMTRSRPPHCRQVSRSMAKTRLRRCAQVSRRWRAVADGSPRLAALAGLVGRGGACPGHDPGPVRARRCEHAVVSGQVRAGLGHQRSEVGDEVLGFEDHVGGAVAIRRLQRITHVPALGQRQPLGGDRGLETYRARRSSLSGCEAITAIPACSEKPELSATARRGASGSAGSVCSANTFWPSRGPVAIR